jgi:rod shape-determining protein MreD
VGDPQPRRLEETLAHEAGRIAALFALACVQVTLLGLPSGFTLPLVPVLAICRALLGVSAAFPDVGLGRALRWGLYGGLALDVFAATPLGAHALALLLAMLIVAALTRRLRVERPAVPLLAVLVGMLIYETVLVLFLQPGAIDWRRYLVVVMLPSVVVALAPTLPLFFLLRRLLRGQL